MGRKIIIKEDKEQEFKQRAFTTSHIMLYVVLGIYIAVSIACIAFLCACIATGSYEYGANILIPTVSLIGACSCTAVGFYTNKATKENEIKLSNEKYRMRLEIAKEIFKEYGSTLDDKSINLLRKLMSDRDTSPTDIWEQNVSQVEFEPINNIGNDNKEGLG